MNGYERRLVKIERMQQQTNIGVAVAISLFGAVLLTLTVDAQQLAAAVVQLWLG